MKQGIWQARYSGRRVAGKSLSARDDHATKPPWAASEVVASLGRAIINQSAAITDSRMVEATT